MSRDRLSGRAGLRAAALRRGDVARRHHQPPALVHSERQSVVPGRDRAADLPADLSVRRRRLPAARDRQPDHRPETRTPYYKGVNENDSVGQSGLEASYDRYLRGVDGAEKVKVDALGNFDRRAVADPAAAGDNLKLSLDCQARGGRASRRSSESIDSNYPANGGAFVAMNPDNGAGLRDGVAAHLQRQRVHQAGARLDLQRAVRPQLRRPAGQPRLPERRADRLHVQADHRHRGARERRVERRASIFDDTGQFCFSGQCRHNAGDAVDGSLDLVRRDQGLLRRLLLQPRRADQLAGARTAARSRSGRATTGSARRPASTCPTSSREPARRRAGATSATSSRPSATTPPARSSGTRPRQLHRTAGRLRDRRRDRPPVVDRRQREPRGRPGRRAGHPAPARRGLLGDRQRRHDRHARTSGSTIQSADGTVLQAIDPPPARHIEHRPGVPRHDPRGPARRGLAAGRHLRRRVRQLPEQVYGKTGTAQYNGQQDYAWYACFVPPARPASRSWSWSRSSRAASARSAPRRWRARSSRSGSSASKGAYVAGSSQTL